jgi:hypothetical protein
MSLHHGMTISLKLAAGHRGNRKRLRQISPAPPSSQSRPVARASARRPLRTGRPLRRQIGARLDGGTKFELCQCDTNPEAIAAVATRRG